MTPASGLAEVGGAAKLYYESVGAGTPVILIHAGIADSRMWDAQVQFLADHFRVVRYDIRGFGQSDIPIGSFSHIEDLRELLDALDVDRGHIIGISKGAAIGLDFAIEHPNRVRSLVLVAPALSGAAWSEGQIASFQSIDRAYEAEGVDAAVEMEMRVWVDGPNRTPDMVDARVREAVRMMDRHNFEREGEAGQESALDPPAAGRLSEVRVPTLVIVGEGDVSDIIRNASTITAGITEARQVAIQAVAHMPTMEKPEEFNQMVLAFLEECDSPTGTDS